MSTYELLEPGWRYRERVRFDVAGLPQPQGSKSAIARAGRAWLIEGKSTVGRARLAAWRQAVAAEARRYADDHPPIDEPVSVSFTFRLPRPASLPVRRYSFATKRPDFDKMTRATCDALTGIVWRDDSLVVRAVIVKRYADRNEAPGCRIIVGVVTNGEPGA